VAPLAAFLQGSGCRRFKFVTDSGKRSHCDFELRFERNPKFANFLDTIYVKGKCWKGKEGKKGRKGVLKGRKKGRKEKRQVLSIFVTGKKVKEGKEVLPTASRPGKEDTGEIL
jgi:hypothetical protein